MISAIDMFCGGGGFTEGIESSGLVSVKFAVNHWPRAVETYKLNHPHTQLLCQGVEAIDPRQFSDSNIKLIVASPECTNFTCAKGGKPYNAQSRATAWEVVRFAEHIRPDWIFVENVKEFLGWGPLDDAGRPIKEKQGIVFSAWLQALNALGYKVEYNILKAANYGAATTRERLFIIATRKGKIRWPETTHEKENWKSSSSIIDWNLECPSVWDRSKPLSENTMRRIRIGIEKFWPEPFVVILKGCSTVRSITNPLPTMTTQGNLYLANPFLVKLYGTATVKSIDVPLDTITAGGNKFGLLQPFFVQYNGTSNAVETRIPLPTITTKDHFGLVSPKIDKIEKGWLLDLGFRMLQPEELLAASGFRSDFTVTGTKAEKVKQIGNAVPPPFAKALAEANL